MPGRGVGVGVGIAEGWTPGRGVGESDGLAVGAGGGEDVAVPPPADGGAVGRGGTQRRPDREADGKGIAWPPPVGVLGGALALGCAWSDGCCTGWVKVSS